MMRGRLIAALRLSALGVLVVGGSPAVAEEGLRPDTVQDLGRAMKSEAFTYLKYMDYAAQARKDGETKLADLLESTAAAERRHFEEEARLAGMVRSGPLNLSDAIIGEYGDAKTMYSQMAERAEAAGDKEVAEKFHEIGEDEARHHQAFLSLLAHPEKGTEPRNSREHGRPE